MNAQYCGTDLRGLQNGSLGVVETTIRNETCKGSCYNFPGEACSKGKNRLVVLGKEHHLNILHDKSQGVSSRFVKFI